MSTLVLVLAAAAVAGPGSGRESVSGEYACRVRSRWIAEPGGCGGPLGQRPHGEMRLQPAPFNGRRRAPPAAALLPPAGSPAASPAESRCQR
jgi:hypothetical protein